MCKAHIHTHTKKKKNKKQNGTREKIIQSKIQGSFYSCSTQIQKYRVVKAKGGRHDRSRHIHGGCCRMEASGMLEHARGEGEDFKKQ
jgi:hypothetical protein